MFVSDVVKVDIKLLQGMYQSMELSTNKHQAYKSTVCGTTSASSPRKTLPKPTSHTMTTPALPQNCIVLCQAEFKINDQSLIHFSKAWLLPRDDIATIDVSSLRASLP